MNELEVADIPTIDVSPLRNGDLRAREQIASAIDQASRDVGMFYVSGHGIDVQRLQDEVKIFHDTITEEEKFRIAINAYNSDNTHIRNGYYMAIPRKKAVESFCYLNPSFTAEHPKIRQRAPMHEVNWWPDADAHPTFRPYCERYFNEMLSLARLLLRGFALALGQCEHYFDEHVIGDDTLSAVSLIHYPYLDDYPPVKLAPDGTRLSFEEHVDVSIITILFQSPVPNLQLETAMGWLDVPVSDCNYLVNCGTYMAYLTKGYYPAPVHRVKWVNADRLSLPFFVHAGTDTMLKPFMPGSRVGDIDTTGICYGDYLQHGFQALIAKNGQT